MAEALADASRRRICLSPPAVATAALLLPGRLHDERLTEAFAAELADLEAIGVMADGALRPWVAEHILLLVCADLHVEVVVAGPHGEAVTQIWARPDAAIIGLTDADGAVDLMPTEPTLLAWTLAATVGLAADHGQVDESRRSLDPSQLAALAAPERAVAWRITARWTAESGPVVHSLSVIDTGAAGLWCSEAPATDLHPSASADVWQRLVAILPPGTSSSPDALPDASPDDPDMPEDPRRTPCPTPARPTPTGSSDTSERASSSKPA